MNMREDNEVDNIISEKKKLAEKNANIKYKQYESEIDKKRKDEDKIELIQEFLKYCVFMALTKNVHISVITSE